jgi:hypothetical protein
MSNGDFKFLSTVNNWEVSILFLREQNSFSISWRDVKAPEHPLAKSRSLTAKKVSGNDFDSSFYITYRSHPDDTDTPAGIWIPNLGFLETLPIPGESLYDFLSRIQRKIGLSLSEIEKATDKERDFLHSLVLVTPPWINKSMV